MFVVSSHLLIYLFTVGLFNYVHLLSIIHILTWLVVNDSMISFHLESKVQQGFRELMFYYCRFSGKNIHGARCACSALWATAASASPSAPFSFKSISLAVRLSNEGN